VIICPQKAHYFDVDGRHQFNGEKCSGCLSCVKVCTPCALERVSKQMSTSEVISIVEADRIFYGEKVV
jgi:Fe-S-cluster-containing hydrogenase component 2